MDKMYLLARCVNSQKYSATYLGKSVSSITVENGQLRIIMVDATVAFTSDVSDIILYRN
mgnify:CR=1 FL=1